MSEASDPRPGVMTPRRRPPLRVCLLGAEGAGKTCFLAGLAILGEPNRHSPFTIRGTDSASVEYFDELGRTLRAQQWLPPTTMSTLLKLSVGVDQQIIEILVVDYDGRDFRKKLRQLRREEIALLHEHFSQSDAVFLLMDPERDVRQLKGAEDAEDQIERQLAHIQAVQELHEQRATQAGNHNSTRSLDVGVVLTKCDAQPELSDGLAAERFFVRHVAAMHEKLKGLADQVGFFPVSAVGNNETVQIDGKPHTIPARELAPKGYEKLFRWVVKRHQARFSRRRNRIMAAVVGTLVLAVAAWWGWRKVDHESQLGIVQDDAQPVVVRLKATLDSPYVDIRGMRDELFAHEIGDIKKRASDASASQAVAEQRNRVDLLLDVQPGAAPLQQLQDLGDDLRQKEEDIAFEQVEQAFNRASPDFGRWAEAFLQEYLRSRDRCEQIRRWQENWDHSKAEAARQRLRQLRVTNAASLKEKSDRIVEFLQEFDPQPVEKTGMTRAAELARRFSQRNHYTVRHKGSGGFRESRYQS